jgi:hypothetical protein
MISAGIAATVAGVPLAQARGSEVDRAQHDATHQQRQAANDARAESAAGVGATDGEEHATQERDADGRRLWETSETAKPRHLDQGDEHPTGQSKDATGNRGNQLDLTG